ncbi:hypothetical protein T08_7520 [Trichinella sp. T8]|nr:hypothetical protein T08_7520 [Trichinella sp. T8]
MEETNEIAEVISQSPNNAPTTNQRPANHKNVSNFRG